MVMSKAMGSNLRTKDNAPQGVQETCCRTCGRLGLWMWCVVLCSQVRPHGFRHHHRLPAQLTTSFTHPYTPMLAGICTSTVQSHSAPESKRTLEEPATPL